MSDTSRKLICLSKMLRQMENLGGQIRLARLRRGYSLELNAERAWGSRQTVWKVEKGNDRIFPAMAQDLLKGDCVQRGAVCLGAT